MTTKTNLGAIYRLEFYKKKKNWSITRASSEANIGAYTDTTTVDLSSKYSRAKHVSRPDLNATYELNSMYLSDGDETTVEHETAAHSVADSSSTCVPDDFLSGSIRGSTSLQSLGSEKDFMSRASLVPHSSELELRQPRQETSMRESTDRNPKELQRFPSFSHHGDIELEAAEGLSRRHRRMIQRGSTPPDTPRAPSTTPPLQRYPIEQMQYQNQNRTCRPSSKEGGLALHHQEGIYHDPPLSTTMQEQPTQNAFACQRQMIYQESPRQSRVICQQKVLYHGPAPFKLSTSDPAMQEWTQMGSERMIYQEPPPFPPPTRNNFGCQETAMHQDPPPCTPPTRNTFGFEDTVMYQEPPPFTPRNKNNFRREETVMYQEPPPFKPPTRNNFRREETVMYQESPPFPPLTHNTFGCQETVMYQKPPPFPPPTRYTFGCEETVMYQEPPPFTLPMQEYPQWGIEEEPPLMHYEHTLVYATPPPAVAPPMARNERVAIIQGRPRRVID